MKPSGTNYKTGVTYTATGITATFSGARDLHYQFRFADRHWYPPTAGGLVPGNTSGISYDHWTIKGFTGTPQGTAVNSSVPSEKLTAPGIPAGALFNLQGRLITSVQKTGMYFQGRAGQPLRKVFIIAE
jgi:hypothetical protein